MLKHYLEEMFEPTLLYGLSLSVIGVAAAAHYGYFSASLGALAIAGTVLAQISVNVISDYFDYSSGLDLELGLNRKSSLAGGSTLIAKGLIKPRPALALGLLAFVSAAAIGTYLVMLRIQLLPILLIAALSILLYSKYVKRIPYLSEPLCTLNYALMVIGAFIVVAGAQYLSYGVVLMAVSAGILLGGDALYINEVPDSRLDRKYGVKHSVAMLRTARKIAIYYIAMQSAAYFLLVLGVLGGMLPALSLLCLVTFISTPYIFSGLYRSDSKRYGIYLLMHTVSSIIFAILLCAALLWSTVII
jgi:1,4-dihydroxy-2-naphthoate octaprenyltransferase